MQIHQIKFEKKNALHHFKMHKSNIKGNSQNFPFEKIRKLNSFLCLSKMKHTEENQEFHHELFGA